MKKKVEQGVYYKPSTPNREKQALASVRAEVGYMVILALQEMPGQAAVCYLEERTEDANFEDEKMHWVSVEICPVEDVW